MASENLNGTVSIDEIKKLDAEGKINRMFDRAPLKDTMKVPYGGYNVIRFYANNPGEINKKKKVLWKIILLDLNKTKKLYIPGYWLFHCHIDSHMNRGMMLVFKVGEHEDFPAVPKDFPKCWIS